MPKNKDTIESVKSSSPPYPSQLWPLYRSSCRQWEREQLDNRARFGQTPIAQWLWKTATLTARKNESVSFQHALPLPVTSFIRERYTWKQVLPVEIYTRIVSVW
jgi:hypothetical protein